MSATGLNVAASERAAANSIAPSASAATSAVVSARFAIPRAARPSVPLATRESIRPTAGIHLPP